MPNIKSMSMNGLMGIMSTASFRATTMPSQITEKAIALCTTIVLRVEAVARTIYQEGKRNNTNAQAIWGNSRVDNPQFQLQQQVAWISNYQDQLGQRLNTSFSCSTLIIAVLIYCER
jgi:hypothetical protein